MLMKLEHDPNAKRLHTDPATSEPFPYALERRDKLRAMMVSPDKAYLQDGVLHWKSNDAIIPPHVFEDAQLVCFEAQRVAYDKHTAEFLKAYRAQPIVQPSGEELWEARAAHGTHDDNGKEIELVDVFSGVRTNLATGKRYK